jgi:hypothetical protein
MQNATMQTRDWSFLLTESPGNISRQNIIIPSGTGKVPAGTVLGELTASPGKFVPSPDVETAGLEGAEVATAILGGSVDATSSDVGAAAIFKIADVKLPVLAFDASVDDETKTNAKVAQLNAVGIRAL